MDTRRTGTSFEGGGNSDLESNGDDIKNWCCVEAGYRAAPALESVHKIAAQPSEVLRTWMGCQDGCTVAPKETGMGRLLGSNVPELQGTLVGGQQQLVEVGAGVHCARHVEI